MLSDLEAFLNQVQDDPELQAQLEDRDLQGVLELAAVHGFTFRACDLLKAQAQQILDMDDDALDLLATGEISDLMSINDFKSYISRF